MLEQNLITDQRPICIFYGRNSFLNDSLISLLSDCEDIQIEEQTNNIRKMLDLLKGRPPKDVLIDLDADNSPIDELIQSIRTRQFHSRIIVLSSRPSQFEAGKVKNWGANGYIHKFYTSQQLVLSIRLVLSGVDFFPQFKEDIIEKEKSWDALCTQHHITQREKEILLLLNKGMTNKEIATSLFLSVLTIETHRKHIMQKLQLKSPTALFKTLQETGL